MNTNKRNYVDAKELIEKYRDFGVQEVEEVVGIWEFYISGCPVKLKIKVVKVEPQGKYMGIANYEIKAPHQATPYRSIRLCDSVQEALEDALKGFLSYWNPLNADKIEFKLDKDW